MKASRSKAGKSFRTWRSVNALLTVLPVRVQKLRTTQLRAEMYMKRSEESDLLRQILTR